MILVTGASGFIGGHLVAALVAGKDAEVRALVRSEAAAGRVRDAAGDAVEVVRGDVTDIESLARAAKGADLVFHLAGAYRGSNDDMRAANVDGTRNVLAALADGARLVYVSSTSVYGWDQRWPADHASPPRPTSAYGSSKLEAERLVQGWSGGPIVIARPTITYGPGDEAGMLARCYQLMRRHVRVFPGDGRNRIHLTHVDDLVRGLVALGGNGDGVFVFAGPEAAPVRRILTLLAAGAGLKPPSFGVPASVLAGVATGVEAVWSAARLTGEPPLSRHGVEVATRDRAYSSQRAADELGWLPDVTLDDGVPGVGRWLTTTPLSRPFRASSGHGQPGREEVAAPSSVSVVSGNARSDGSLGFDWRSYVEDPDEGLGTVYERFALDDVLADAVKRTGATSVLHAPLFGMMGFPGLDAVTLARTGVRVGLLDFEPQRMAAVKAQWAELGLEPETHLVEGPDATSWPDQLSSSYDLVFSFAALWWFDDPWAVVAAQARWAQKGVLVCVPNKNVFMRMRASLWHKDLFTELNEDSLDRRLLARTGEDLGLKAVDTGLFDIPPFPDTSVPLAKVARAALAPFRSKSKSKSSGDASEPEGEGEGAWAWSILPYLRGADPDLPARVAKLSQWERYVPKAVAPGLAHHRYTLFVDPLAETGPAAPASAVTT
ncbi:MAG: NAD-dependent epimerase/dehydratase family protein [Acidimicrobiales bacterium]